MIYRYFLILFILCLTANAQNIVAIDSLKMAYEKQESLNKKSKTLINIANYYKYRNLDSLILYVDELQVINNITKSKKNIFEECLLTSFIGIQKNNDSIAFYKADQSIDLAKAIGSNALLGLSHFNKSNIYHYYKNNFTEALKYKLKAESYFSKTDSLIDSRINNLSSIAFIYKSINDYENAILHVNKAANLLDENINLTVEGNTYNTLGMIYSELDTQDKALRFLKKAQQSFQQANYMLGEKVINFNMAVVHFNNGEFEIAERMFKNGLIDNKKYIFEQDISEDRIIKSKIYLAKIAIIKKEYDKALTYLNYVEEKAEHICFHCLVSAKLEKIKLFSLLNKNNKTLTLIDDLLKVIGGDQVFFKELETLYLIQSNIYRVLKQKDKELETFKNYIEIKEKQDSINNRLNIEALKLSFMQEKANKEILQQQRLIKTLKEKEKIKSKNSILIISILAIMILFLALFFFRQKKLNAFVKKNWAAEKMIKDLKEAQLLFEVKAKKQQLTDIAIHINEKNALLEKIKSDINKSNIDKNNADIRDLLFFINEDLDRNKEKYQLYNTIDNSNESFHKNLLQKYPELNEKERKVATLIRLGNSSKQISLQLGIAKSSINNYRYSLRKKFNLSREESLYSFVKKI